MQASSTKKNKFVEILIFISQVIFVPIYAFGYYLVRLFDLTINYLGIGLNYVSKGLRFIGRYFYAYFFKYIGLACRFLNRALKKLFKHTFGKLINLFVVFFRNEKRERLIKRILIGILIIVLAPVIVLGLVFAGIYILFHYLNLLLRKAFKFLFRKKKTAKKEKVKDIDESLRMRKFRYFIYSVKRSISNYFHQYIFIFSKNREQTLLSRKKQKKRFIILMLAFPIAQFLVFWVYVNFNSILLAFQMEMDGEIIYTFQNFKRFFIEVEASGGKMLQIIKNTIKFFPVNVFITLPLSFIFSYFLFKKVPGSGVYRVIFYLPAIVSAVSLTMLFRYIVSVTGPFSVVEKGIGMTPLDFLGSEKHAMNTILFYTVWTGFGMNIVLLSSAMARIPKELFEAAAIDGVGTFREMFSIVLPLSWGTISTLIVLSATQLFTVLGPIILLTNGQHGTSTIASIIYYQVKSGSENAFAYASAIGLVFTIIGLPIVLILKKALDKINKNIEF